MRRKSERNKSKSSVEKKTVEPSPRKSRRTSRRRKRSTSHSSSDDSDDVPLKTTVAVVEKQETVVCAAAAEPKKSASHSASDEDKQEQPIWKVKTSEAPSGEIQKLKICLQRPPTTPERTEKSPRRRRGKASSQSDDASLTPDEKAPASTGRRRLRRGSPAITTPSALAVPVADLDAIVKDECTIVVTESNDEVRLGKGKFECSQTTDGQSEGSRTVALPSGDESLTQCEIKQDDSIATTRVAEQRAQEPVELQQMQHADGKDSVKHVTSIASTQKQNAEEPVAVAEKEEREEGSSKVVKDTSTSSSSTQAASKVSNVEEKKVDSSQQSTDVSSLSTGDIKQQSKDAASKQSKEAASEQSKDATSEQSKEATSEQITKATSQKITEPAVKEITKTAVKEITITAVKEISDGASQKIIKAASQKTTETVSQKTTESALKEISEPALKEITKPTEKQISDEVVRKTSEQVVKICSQKSAISPAASEETSEAVLKQASTASVKITTEASVKETSAICSQQSAISLTASELTSQETSDATQPIKEAASQETSVATQPIKEAASTETNEATSQQTKGVAVQQTIAVTRQQTKEAAVQETIAVTRQQTNETTSHKTKQAAVQETKQAAVQETKQAAVQETKEPAVQKTNEATAQQTKEAAVHETKQAAVQETKEPTRQETKDAALQQTKEATRQETNEAVSQQTKEASVPESSEATAQDTNEAVSDQTIVTLAETSEVSSQRTNDTVSSEVTSQNSEDVCTQSTEVTGETKDSSAASPDTTEASNNEVTSSDASAMVASTVQPSVTEVTSAVTREQCTVVPKETSEAECIQVDSNSEVVVGKPEIPQTSEQSEHKSTVQESIVEEKDSIKSSEGQLVCESVETKIVTEEKPDLKDRNASPKPEKTSVVQSNDGESSKQSSTEKESASSEPIPVNTTNITEDLSASVRSESCAGKPTNRKRKWGKYEALLLPDEHITMDKISKLYPSMKILSEDELRMDTEDVVRDKPPRKEREVTVQAPTLPPLAVKDEDVEKEISNIGLNRKISIVNDEASKLQPPPSPSKNAVSAVLYITNLVRPFTLKQLKELLSRTGTILDDGFWTDRIKSKCYVQYENADEAEATRNALHGVQWPIGNGKKLMIDFGTREAMEAARNATTEAPAAVAVVKAAPEKLADKDQPTDVTKKEPPVEESRWEKTKAAAPVREWDVGKVPQDQRDRSRSRERPTSRNDRTDKRRHSRNESPPNGDHVTARKKKKDEPAEVKLMDDLFHKTKATPSIYWLPLTPEQIAKKQQQRLQRMAEHKRRMEESRRGERDFGRGGARTRNRRSARHDGD